MNSAERTGTPSSMNTLSEIIDLAVSRGYAAPLKITPKGLFAPDPDRYFSPEQSHIDNFYRFEGASNPDDMSILYLIETSDGTKGTIVDAYGTYADSLITDFIKAVENMHKKPSE